MGSSGTAATYTAQPGRHDEMLGASGRSSAPWVQLGEVIDRGGAAGRANQLARVRRTLRAHGATFDPSGGHDLGSSLDPVPVLLQLSEWDRLLAGLAQRARTIEALLADVYGEQQTIRRGSLPAEVVFASPGFMRPLVHTGDRDHPFLSLYAADLARTSDGSFVVLADRTQAPTGIGHALENRRVVRSLFPDLAHRFEVEPLTPWFERLRATLASRGVTAPSSVDRDLPDAERAGADPRIVMLCPGAQAEASFEDGFLASNLGYTLVQGPDLTVRDGKLWLKSVSGLEPVDVVYRRLPDVLCDPLELRSDSFMGVPGLVECVRRGTVAIANELGTGFGENPGLMPFFSGLTTDLLGEEPILDQPNTWWCGDPSSLDHVLANLDGLVLRSISERAGRRSRFGRTLSPSERTDMVDRIRARPHQFVAQEEVPWATTPALDDDGVTAVPMMLRSFLVADSDGGSWHGMPGALVRTGEDPSKVSLTGGGPSKDLWVLDPGDLRPKQHVIQPMLRQVDLRSSIPSRAAEGLFWVGRNLERAELVVRLVESARATLDSSPELATEADGAWLVTIESLIESVVGPSDADAEANAADEPSRPTADPLSTELFLAGALRDESRPLSVATSLQHLLGSANSVRELFAMTMWQVLADLSERLDDLRASASSVGAPMPTTTEIDLSHVSRQVIVGLSAMSGLIAESMVRDPGWWFMDIGRRIERSLLLLTTISQAEGAEPLEQIAGSVHHTLLASWDSLVTYRRRHRSDVATPELLALLLTDGSNPRSLRHQLHRLHGDVGFLPSLESTAPSLQGDLAALLARVDGLDTNVLSQPNDAGDLSLLVDELADIEAALRSAADGLNLAYFARVEAVSIGVESTFEGEMFDV